MEAENQVPGRLFVVATPIGNLKDITLRAVETLKAADFLVVEDTRVTLKLLNHLGLKKPMLSYFRHSSTERLEEIMQRLVGGETAAVVCDAGTPCISDPGEELVKACFERGILVTPVPGASALLAGVSACGLGTGRFCFEGFLPTNNKNRKQRLLELQSEERALVFYEAPHKLLKTLKDFVECFGGSRRICVARELTKVYEQFLQFTLAEAVSYFEATLPKGEFVLILEGAAPAKGPKVSRAEAEKLAKARLAKGKSKTEIAKELARVSELSRQEAYALLLE